MKSPILTQKTLESLIDRLSISDKSKKSLKELIPSLGPQGRIELLKGIIDLLALEEEKEEYLKKLES